MNVSPRSTPHILRTRRVVALVLAIGVLPMIVGGAYLQREAVQHARESQDLRLADTTRVSAGVIAAQLERAATVGSLIAGAPAFQTFYTADAQRPAAATARLRRRAESTLSYIARLYTGSVGEIRFVDRSGAEHARLLGGRPAPPSERGPNDRPASFLAPALALAPGGVAQSRPYLSPETRQWVVSTAAPVTVDGVTRGAVQFELTLESLRAALAKAAPEARILIVDRKTGEVVLSSRRPQGRGDVLAASADAYPARLVRAAGPGGVGDAGDARGAWLRVRSGVSNANDWYVVALAEPEAVALLNGALIPFAVMAAALLLLGWGIARRSKVVFKVFAERFERAGAERLDALARNSSDVVTLLDAGGVVRVQTGAIEEILGYRPEELAGTLFGHLIHPEDRHLLDDLLGAGGPLQVEWRLRHGDGSWRHMESSVSDLPGDPRLGGSVLTSRDIGARKLLEDQLRHRAFHDPLTGLPNRALFHDRIEHALARERRSDRLTGVIFVDLDNFKLVNDRFGHAGGDELLTGAAQRLRSALRSVDTVARVGGDEFGVLLEDIDGRGEAEGTAERILSAFREPLSLHGEQVFIRPSLGVAIGGGPETTVEELLGHADVAMYAAKRGGKGCYQVYDAALAEAGVERAPGAAGEEPDRLTWFVRGEEQREEVEAVLSRNDSIRTVFQPLVDLRTGDVVGYEALSRFDDPKRRPPNAWFAQAARCGLGSELEARALEIALAAASARPAGTYVSLNLSPSALLSAAVERVLPIDLSDMVIEITENELLFGGERLSSAISRLRRRGAQIAIDDAGAGYAGLKHLMLLQPDIVKLDRGLVESIGGDPAKQALIDAFVRFAREIGARVCAEGIEELEDLVLLADLDVAVGQGYALGRPAEEFAQTLAPAARALREATAESQRFGCAGRPRPAYVADRHLEIAAEHLGAVVTADDLGPALQAISEALQADAICVSRLERDSDRIRTLATFGALEEPDFFALGAYPATAAVIETGEVMQVMAGDEAADASERAELLSKGHASLLMVPILSEGRGIGLLEAFTHEQRPSSRLGLARARLFAYQLGLLLEKLEAAERAADHGPGSGRPRGLRPVARLGSWTLP